MCTEQSKDERIRELEGELEECKQELKNYRDVWLESEERHKISAKVIEELNGKNARMCLELKALKERFKEASVRARAQKDIDIFIADFSKKGV